MNIEAIAVELRPRTPWEAVDLGFAMARRWWRPVFGAWLMVAAPLYVVVWLLLGDWPLLAVAALWWLRPMMDRVPLFVLSRSLFGATPTLKEVARALPSILRPRLFDGLVVQRLDTMRSLHLPVSELEGGPARARSRRRAVIRRAIALPASWLTACALLLNWTLLVGFLSLVLTFTPEGPQWSAAALISDTFDGAAPAWWMVALVVCDFAAISVVEPFYVAAGFGLYINRRSGLEGWDVELAFRRMARRLAALGARAAPLLLVFALAAAPAWAQEAAAQVIPAEAPAEVAAEVLEGPEFGETVTERRWRLRDRGESEEGSGWLYELLERLVEWLMGQEASAEDADPGLSGGLGMLLQGLAWVGVGLGLCWLAVALLRWYDRTSPAAPSLPSRPALTRRSGALAGAALDPEGTDAVVAAARRLIAEGLQAEALALLYRSAVGRLVDRGLPLADGATEGECLRAVRYDTAAGLSQDAVAFFGRLTRSWQAAAYAHQAPDADVLSVLCEGWGAHFGEAG